MTVTRGLRAAVHLLAGSAGFAAALYGAYLGVASLRTARVTRLGRAW
jgi:hypothetical protein